MDTKIFLRRLAVVLVGAALVQPVVQAMAGGPEARYDALLWRISGGGAARPSYLYGTMHVSNKVAFHLSEEFFTALEQSDLVALEMDPTSWLGELASSKWFSAFASLSGEAQGSTDLYRDAFKLAVPDRKAIARALAQDPEVINQLLYRMSSGNADHEEDTYLDLFIYQCGRRAGKPVLGLEAMEHSVLQLVKAMGPDGREPDPVRMRRIREAYANGGDPAAAIEDSYRTQDLDRMDSLFDLTSTDDRLRKYVIDERNTVFLDALLPVLRQRSVFVGVGAMHLPGPHGLIEMLRAKGYTVEPVRGGVTARSRAQQRKHEDVYHPVEWTTQWATDSSFSIDLPAPLQLLPLGGDRSGVLLAADMVNGSHFMVQRLPTYAALRGRSMEDVMAQVDSALYEGVPGRIERTTRFRTSAGWPGLDVRSVDRAGRVASHRVVVSPFEIFIFERTMRDVPQAAKDGERAFASIRFQPPRNAKEGAWRPACGGLEVALPPARHVREATPRMGILGDARIEQLYIAQAADGDGRKGLLAMSAFFPDVTTIEQDTFELDVLAEQFGRSFGLSAVRIGAIPIGTRSVRAHGLQAGGDTVHYLVALDGGRYDLLCARAPRADADRFFGSYRRVPYRTPEPLSLYADTLLHFSTRTASTQQELWKQVAGFSEYFQQVARNLRKEKGSHVREDRSILYRSSSTPEAVLVDYERPHRFATYEDETAFWDERVEGLARRGGLTVKDRRMTGAPETRRLECLLTDSASSRTVRVVMQQCPGAVYTLRSIADADGRLTAWPDSFMAGFRTDTVFSEGLFRKKGTTLLQWLSGTDSTQAAQARSSFSVAEFADADAPALIAYIRSSEARDKEKGQRRAAIGKLGGVHHPQVVPFLKEIYTASGDTVETQLEVLEALARQHTREGAGAFLALIVGDPPLTEQNWLVGSAFSPFFDSLEVARTLFPRAWSLTRFPEFEGRVVNLAAALVEKGLMAPADYAERKPELMDKAKAALKRAIADGRKEPSEYDDEDEMPTSSPRNYFWGPDAEIEREEDVQKPYADVQVGAWTPAFTAYQHLLLPFRKEPAVAAYFDQALRSGADGVELSTAVLLLAKGAPVPADLWKRYAERDDARLRIYRTLTALQHPELFDRALLTPEKNAWAYLVAGDKTYAADSVRIAGTRRAGCRLGSGTVYFFLNKVDNEDQPDEWHLSGTGFFDDGAAQPFADRFIRWAKENMARSEGTDKAIDAMLADLRYLGRPRWKDAPGPVAPPPPLR
ncbi:MAG: TraB/GumN family protein [Bacteroidetes bacterium]|nr:TraB/GumN family protein [Bacteroidota bacterium]